MKAFLMDAGRDFDIDADLPVNARDLTADLGLDILLDAMAAGDTFLRKAAERGLHAGLASPAGITYRQHVLADCVARPATVRELYDLAVEAMNAERKVFGFLLRDSPDTILHRSREVMEIQLASLRRLADITRRERNGRPTAAARSGCPRVSRCPLATARTCTARYSARRPRNNRLRKPRPIR
jgi:hypothetical protein